MNLQHVIQLLTTRRRLWCLTILILGYSHRKCVTTDWTIGVRSPAEAKDFFSSLCVETIFEAHPASYALGTGDPYPGVKGDRDVRLTTQPLPGPRSRMSRRNASYPPWRLHGGSGTALDYFYVYLNTKCSAENLDLRKRKWQKGR
jgi:hypothetical protein